MYSYIWKTRNIGIKGDAKKYSIVNVMPILWREHCVECAAPGCYKTCKLYKPRIDKRCMRFDYGIQPVYYDGEDIIGAKISLRRWAKLEASLGHSFYSVKSQKIMKLERLNRIASIIKSLCSLINNYRLSQIYASLHERYISKLRPKKSYEVNGFFAVIKSYSDSPKTLLLEILGDDLSLYRESMVLHQGWNEYFIPIEKFPTRTFNFKKKQIRAYLNDNETAELEFRYFDFVKRDTNKEIGKPANKIKCVAWDLDNTLWEGVIGDVGHENVSVKHEALKSIKKFDEMGILQTIVSKNTYEIAWAKIEELELQDYFLYPAINWGRKSESLKTIAKELNINIDTFAFIDDSSFERNEVKSALPQVRVFDVVELPELLSKTEFDIPITIASKNRRVSYLNEVNRKNITASWEGDYDTFLKSCKLEMRIFTLQSDIERERCLELIQRSNQYNISVQRQTEKSFNDMLTSELYKCFGMSLSDEYGDYGIIGFASFKHEGNRIQLQDFVMSCRVAQKKVERAFFNHILNQREIGLEFYIKVQKTERNKPLQDEFKKMPLNITLENKETISFKYIKKDSSLFINESIIKII
jgi:FkbH-like protein